MAKMAVRKGKKNTPKSKPKKIVEEIIEESSSEESSVDIENVANSSEEDSGSEEAESASESEEESIGDNDMKKGFTDDNAEWLKPKSKSKLLDSDDDDSEEEGDEIVGNSDASDDEDMLEIERESKLLDQQMEVEQEEAAEEYRRTIAENSATFHLPSTIEIEEEQDGTRVVPPSELRERINEILTVLADFKNRREPNRARTEYIAQLSSDMAELFGYLPELVDYFLTMFNPSETLEFLEASDTARPMVIRTNTLKTRRKDLAASLLKRGVTLDPLANWSKVGLKITASPIPVGATPEYLSGQYMLQSAASFCPVLALNPSPGNELVLDMSAAPGGKTSYLAQLMRNTGIIIANDLKADRQKATVANMHRLGVRNVVTSCYDGRKLGKLWKNRFSKILLDAPCSGLGVISRDPSVKVQRTIKDVERCGVLQKELLLNAIDALSCKGKDGGIMVYSTCSVSVAENEDVVNYVLGKRDVKIMKAGLDFGKTVDLFFSMFIDLFMCSMHQ
jgi:ribosomal RNA methyltransferase Nop2